MNVTLEVELKRMVTLQFEVAENKYRQQTRTPRITILMSVTSGSPRSETLDVRTKMVLADERVPGASEQGEGGDTIGTQRATVQSVEEGSRSKVKVREAL